MQFQVKSPLFIYNEKLSLQYNRSHRKRKPTEAVKHLGHFFLLMHVPMEFCNLYCEKHFVSFFIKDN